ncbi:MAG: pyridoxal phosphate-dependent transferase [Linnemannia gamsii]|nr:MAG: pyridoxal phosphate-dependent transferase [Linnemannia gamsii]
MSTDLCQDAQELDLLITRMKDLLVEYMEESRQPQGRLVDYKEPHELEQIMDFSLPDLGVGPEGIFPTITQTLKHSVNTFSPRFMDKLYAGSSPIGVLSELLLAGLNGNSHVYHVSPVFTMMEIHVTRALARLYGFHGDRAGGLSCPGGSASNQLAMVTARNSLYPEIKKHGYIPRPSIQQQRDMEERGYSFAGTTLSTYGKLIAFTSSAGHYSMEKSAVMMGLGTENIVSVPCDSYGAMIPSELERLIQENIALGHTPFFVNATAGTTVLGAFDPIRPCGEIAQKYNCWLHVDGSWGGATIFVPELAKTLLDGSELAQSITVNPHKMLQTSLQCSLLLVPDSSIFPRANALKANYLFHGQSHDLGDGTLGCGRRSDAVKLFLGWKYYGRLGYKARIEKSLSNVKRFGELLAQDNFRDNRIQMLRLGSDHEDFLHRREVEEEGKRDKTQPSLLQICFWYRPRNSRLIDWRGTERIWKNSEELFDQESPSRIPSTAATPLVGSSNNQPYLSGLASNDTTTAATKSTVSSNVSSNSSTTSLESYESTSTASSVAASTILTSIDRGAILVDPQERQQAKEWMEQVTKLVHARIRHRGVFMIDYAPLGPYLPLFFRVVLNPPTIREIDLTMLVNEILECGDIVESQIETPACCRVV